MESKEKFNEWVLECEQFQTWFKSLGGNIANNEQMTEAFNRIEAKNISDRNLYDILEHNEKYINNIEAVEPIEL